MEKELVCFGVSTWWNKAMTRDGCRCVICGEKDINKLLVHHKDESRKTGVLNNKIENLETLCRKCHAWRHSHIEEREDILEYRAAGLTFAEIGKILGISRQRVHKKYHSMIEYRI